MIYYKTCNKLVNALKKVVLKGHFFAKKIIGVILLKLMINLYNFIFEFSNVKLN